MRLPFLPLLLLALLAAAPAPAPPIKPPLEALRGAPALVRATITGIATDPARIEITVDAVLAARGTPRQTLALLVEAPLLDRVEVGGHYLLAYDDLARVPGKPGHWQQTERARLYSSDGAEPAIFRYGPEIEALFAPTHRDAERAPDYRQFVLAALASARDPQLQNLWAAEFAFRPAYWQRLDEPDRARLFAVVADRDAHPSARARLLEGLCDRRHGVADDRLAGVVGTLLAGETTLAVTDLMNPEVAVLAAFDCVEQRQIDIDPSTLERWLASPRPALSERALLALRRGAEGPAGERAAIERTLSRQLLPTATRAFLLDHQRRLDLADQQG